MTVKEWIEKLKAMPEDAEVYYYFLETGEYMEALPEFIDLNHQEFQNAKKYSYHRVAEKNPYVVIQYTDNGRFYTGINLYDISIKEEDFGEVTATEALELIKR